MLDMGFEPQIARIVALAPAARQTLLFSATYPPTIAELSRAYQVTALSLDVPNEKRTAAASTPADSANPSDGVQHHYYELPARQHVRGLGRWLERARPESTLVFCSTRQECLDVAAELSGQGWVAAAINGDMPQQERRHVMRLFANKSCSVLAATDLAARGWDITGLSAVVNLGLSRDPTVHVHRIGRTGRSGQPGQVVSFVGEEDGGRLRAIERTLGSSALLSELPTSASGPAAVHPPPMLTLLLGAGKDRKLRPGDILGALTAPGGVQAGDVGNIEIDERHSYVAVRREHAEGALAHLLGTTIKGFRVKARVAGLTFRDPR
jgi:ATP-independent RNA helicase DbpA